MNNKIVFVWEVNSKKLTEVSKKDVVDRMQHVIDNYIGTMIAIIARVPSLEPVLQLLQEGIDSCKKVISMCEQDEDVEAVVNAYDKCKEISDRIHKLIS